MKTKTALSSDDGRHQLGLFEKSPGDDPQSVLTAVSPVTVLIVEDSPIVRQRLVALVDTVPNVRVVGQAEDGFQAQALFRKHRPDAVVLDIQLPGINGFDLLAEFKRKHPACVVMVLTTYAFQEFRQRSLTLGADYFFDKTMEFERIPGVLGALPRHSQSVPKEASDA